MRPLRDGNQSRQIVGLIRVGGLILCFHIHPSVSLAIGGIPNKTEIKLRKEGFGVRAILKFFLQPELRLDVEQLAKP